jgi:hypothetical protein
MMADVWYTNDITVSGGFEKGAFRAVMGSPMHARAAQIRGGKTTCLLHTVGYTKR